MANWWDDPELNSTASQQAAPAVTKADVQAQQAQDADSINSPWGHFMDYISGQMSHAVDDTVGFIGDVGTEGSKVLVNMARHGMHGGTTADYSNFHLPGSGVVSQATHALHDKIMGPDIPARSKTEQRIGSVARGAADMIPGALAAPEAAVSALMSGAGAGAGSEIAGELFPNSDLAQFLGGIIGGFGPHAVESGVRSVKTGRMINDGMKHPDWQAVNNVIVGDLEGGGTLSNPKTSPKGAVGPQQVMPETARNPGFGIRPWDGKSQADLARVGRQYSAAMMSKYDGDASKVFAAYNAGPGRVDELVKKYGDNWHDHLPSETKQYVSNGLSKLGGFSRYPTPPEAMDARSMGQGADYPDQVAANDRFDDSPLSDEEQNRILREISSRSPELTPAEQQEMDASAPKPIVDNTGYETHTPYVGDPSVPANDDLHSLLPATVENAKKGYGDWVDDLVKSQGPQSNVRDVVSANDYHPFDAEEFNKVKEAALSGNKRAESTLAHMYRVNIHANDLVERDQNPPASSSTFGTTKTGKNVSIPEKPIKSAEGHDGPDPKYEGLSPRDKLIEAIRSARPSSAEQRKLIHEARSKQAAVLKSIQDRGGSYEEELNALRGSLPSSDYESIRHNFSPDEVKHLETMINQSHRLLPFEKVNVKASLHKLLGKEGVKVPTALELRNLQDVFGSHLTEAIYEKMGMTAGQMFSEVVSIPKSILASGDVSGTTRQGVWFVGRKHFWKSYPVAVKVMFNRYARGLLTDKDLFTQTMEGLKDMPTYPMMKTAGLKLGDKILDKNDFYRSGLAEKMPEGPTVATKFMANMWNNTIGRHVAASDEAFTTALAVIRAGVFNDIYLAGKSLGVKWDHASLRRLGDYVNTGSGHGSLGKAEQASSWLATFLWSPRLIGSRVKLLNPIYYTKLALKDPFLAKQAARDAGSYVTAMATVLGMAAFAGADVETDPRSTNFAKIKIGDVYIDPTGGFQPYVRLLAQEITGQRKNSKGEIQNIGPSPLALVNDKYKGREPKFGQMTRLQDAENFAVNKLAPVPGMVARFGAQTDYIPFSVKGETEQLAGPLYIPDIANEVKSQGAEAAVTRVLIPSIIGLGVQVQTPRTPKTKTSKKDWWDEMSKPTGGRKKKEWWDS